MIAVPEYLDYVQFYPTLRCNLSCEFCFNSGIGKDYPDIPPERLQVVLEKLRRTGVRTIDVMGGEPFLHYTLDELIAMTVERGYTLNLSTNGTYPGGISSLLERFQSLNIGISINDPSTLDNTRQVLESGEVIAKTIYRENLAPEVVEEVSSLKPREYYLIFPDEMRRGKEDRMLSFRRFYNRFVTELREYFTGAVYCSGFLPALREYPHLERMRCPAGTVKIGLLPDGSVYPCNLFFRIEEFCLGNIFDDPVEDILRDERLGFFREFQGNQCPVWECGLHRDCHGGCPAHALIHFGRLDAPDPRCLYGSG
jgi:radical SAM protein with 4Fe4S-binding SPASM domain